MADLFSKQYEQAQAKIAPLADRMRPQTLEEFVGQEHLLAEGKLLREIVEKGQLVSLIFWGPPGCGKTTLARLIAQESKARFVQFSAVTSGISEVRNITKEAGERLKFHQQRTILFVDEIHRFNKAQQDAFLPHVEKGTVVLMGATTENPSFEVISPLLSRCRVVRLEHLSSDEIRLILERAIKDKERGLGKHNTVIESEALEHLVSFAGGDVRVALNALEVAASMTERITLPVAEQAIQQRVLAYDKTGDSHYDTISAFIKSLRGSDPDAALHYLARMLKAGEAPRFIARRMVIFASEDIGNADPMALVIATACAQAVEYVGMPECQLNLAQATTYLAGAEKSNASYKALMAAYADLENIPPEPIPLHLRNPATNLMQKEGYGKDYKYPHDFDEHWVDQEYMPPSLKERQYYHPTEMGKEKEIKERLKHRKKSQGDS